MEDDSFVYFTFTENSIEDFTLNFPDANLRSWRGDVKRVSRIARVCKNDRGHLDRSNPDLINMWTTFRKVSLACSCHGNQEFDQLFLTRELNSLNRFVSVFHQTSSNHSAICEFDRDEVRSALSSKKFWISGNHEDLSEDNVKYYLNDLDGCDLNEPLSQKFHSDLEHKLNDEEMTDNYGQVPTDQTLAKLLKTYPTMTRDDMAGYYEFLSRNTILNRVVRGQCKFVLPYKINALSLHEDAVSMTTHIYASSARRIIKLVRNPNSIYDHLIDINLNSSRSDWFTSILFSKSTNSLYMADKKAIRQLDFSLLASKVCSAFKTCQECLQNANCLWDSKCVPRTRGTEVRECSDQSKLPPEWHQVTGFLNRTIVLKCSIGDLDMGSYWTRGGQLVPLGARRHLTTKGDLVLTGLENSDQGNYECKSDLVKPGHQVVTQLQIRQEPQTVCPSEELTSQIILLNHRTKKLEELLRTLDCS